MSLFTFFKNIIFIAVFISFAPVLIGIIRIQYSNFLEPHTPIGVIKIKQYIAKSDFIVSQLHSFFKNHYIKAIVLKINCSQAPIGTAQLLYNEIQHLKKEYPKPIVTLVENICTSEGYLIACSSDYIVAPSCAIIGKVDIASPSSNTILDDNIQQLHNEISEQLAKTVAVTRKLSLSTTYSWGQGKVFTAEQAQKIGLIDEIGSLHQLIKILKNKAFIEGEINWIHKPKNHSLYRWLNDLAIVAKNYSIL